MRFLRSAGILFMAVAISAQIPPSTISAPPDVASVPADATKTASGLATRVLTPGTGKDHPTKDDIVVVNYTGWLYEAAAPGHKGAVFDSSLASGTPLRFKLGAGEVIKGWDQGVIGMKAGGRRRLTIPPELAYGDSGAGRVIPPSATLLFDVELVAIE